MGIDIGSHAIKLIRLASSSRGYQLLNVGMIPIPPDIIVEGAISDAAAIENALRRLMEMEKVAAKDIALALPGHSVIVKKALLPRTTEEELANAMPYEAEQHIPFDVYDVNIDFQILDTDGKGDSENAQMDVLLVAAKKGRLEELTHAAEASGLRPAVVDVDIFALINCFELNYPEEMIGRVVSLVHIGASLMTVAILKDGLSTFQRDVTLGGNQYTEALQKALSLTREEAESVKLGVASNQISPTRVLTVLHSVTEQVAVEIQRSFEFYMASVGEETVEKVYISGGCARMQGLVPILDARLQIPVELFDPFRQIEVPEKLFDLEYVREMSPMVAISVGLAMRQKGDR